MATDPEALPEHGPEWVEAICDSGPYVDASRYYRFEDGREFVFPAVRRTGPAGLGGWVLSHPPAWGMGGVVGAGLDAEVLAAVLDDLHGLRAQRVWVRPNPLHAEHWSTTRAGTAIPRRGHVLDLTGGMAAVEERLHRATRKYVRRARRAGVEVSISYGGADLEIYYRLYLTSIDRWSARQHEPRWLARWRGRRRDPLDKLRAIGRHLGPSFVLALAHVDGEAAYGAIMLLGPTAHVTRSAMDVDRVGPTKAGALVHHHLLQIACDHGCRRYHLGESGGSASLAQFKEGLGAVPYEYAEYRFERLPYSRLDQGARTLVKRAIGFRDH